MNRQEDSGARVRRRGEEGSAAGAGPEQRGAVSDSQGAASAAENVHFSPPYPSFLFSLHANAEERAGSSLCLGRPR